MPEVIGSVKNRVVASRGFKCVRPSVCSRALRHFSKSPDVAQWTSDFDDLHTFIGPQEKAPPIPQLLTCAQAGFCLAQCAKTGHLPAVEVMVEQVLKLFSKSAKSASENRRSLDDGGEHLAAAFYDSDGSRSTVRCFRVAVGSAAHQCFLEMRCEEAPWVREGKTIEQCALVTKPAGKLRWPCHFTVHGLCERIAQVLLPKAAMKNNFVVKLIWPPAHASRQSCLSRFCLLNQVCV